MSDMAIARQLTIGLRSVSHTGERVSSCNKYAGVYVVAHELQTTSRFSPCECFRRVPLIKCALIGNLDEGATGRSIYESIRASETAG